MDAFDALMSRVASRLRSSPPDSFAQLYGDRLREQGYAPRTVQLYLGCLSQFRHWLSGQRFELPALEHHIERFSGLQFHRGRCAGRTQRVPHSMRAALEQLRIIVLDSGVQLDTQQLGLVDDLLQRFDRHLQQMKGLAASTRRRRLVIVRPLVSMTNGSGLPSPDQLRQFLHHELSRVSAASAGVTTAAVRSYLRFRAFEGQHVERLLAMVMSPASWRLAPLPQTLTPDEVRRLLDTFPAGYPSRLRGYAIVRCLVDLGLRSSEVIALDLDDIDWAAGIVRIRKAKSRRADVLPLPQVTGAAIAEYIRCERPRIASRRIFVRHVAPAEVPVSAEVVRRTVREAYRRAGLPHTRIHILRHTLASRLLNTGGTLKEVADVLRHRELDTSLIYAKVDVVRLGAVAMPWPGSQP